MRNNNLTYLKYTGILVIPYRMVYPDGLGEWYFRDECSRVVRHIDTDAAVNKYEFGENGNLTTITQSDGATFSKKK